MSEVKRPPPNHRPPRKRPRRKESEVGFEEKPVESLDAPSNVTEEPASAEHSAPEEQPETEVRAPTPTVPEIRPHHTPRKPSDEYCLQTYYDKGTKQFVAWAAEFPELRTAGHTREDALIELELKLDQQIQNLRRRGESVPEAIQARKYPEKLEIRVSQNLFRKLDLLSRQEKVGLDQLVVELLSSTIEKSLDTGRPQRSQSQSSGGRHQQRHPQHQQHRRGGPHRGYHDTMQSRENFMEYVRSLEKGGGHWRKK